MGRGIVVMLVAGGCLLGGAPLSAASFTLSPRETQEAVRVGQRSVVAENYDGEWRTVNAAGERLLVVTPFFRIVQAARNAAFRDEPLRQREIDGLLREQRERLLFWAYLRGGSEDFARWYRPVLVVPGRGEVRPSFVQNERTALRQDDGRYLSRSLYAFPVAGLDARGRITLVVRDHEEREVTRFAVDLSTMR